MKLITVLVPLFLIACGGPNFQSDETEETDSGSDSNPPLPDSLVSSPDTGRADGSGGFESDAGNDSWPNDVILEPYCPTSEIYPNPSNTCYVWGAEHGWTVPACCLPDHSCGTIIQGVCRR